MRHGAEGASAGPSFTIAHAEAERVLRVHAVTTPPVDVEGIAERLGLQVLRITKANGPLGQLIPEQQLIVVNTRDGRATRERFTVAHEVGHWCLRHHERDIIEFLDDTMEEDPSQHSLKLPPHEQEANAFASALLMPAAMVREAVRAQGRRLDVDALAIQFRVSLQAMWWRVMDLRLLP